MQVSIKLRRLAPAQKFTSSTSSRHRWAAHRFEVAGGDAFSRLNGTRWAQGYMSGIWGEAARRHPNDRRARHPDHDVRMAGFPANVLQRGVTRRTRSIAHGFLDETHAPVFRYRAHPGRKSREPWSSKTCGICSATKGQTFQTIRRHLRAAGYLENWQLVSAVPFVPQSRTRIFIVALRRGPKFAFPPTLTHEDRYPVLADILEKEVPKKYTLTDHLWNYLQNYQRSTRRPGTDSASDWLPPMASPAPLARYKGGIEILIPLEERNPGGDPRECGG